MTPQERKQYRAIGGRLAVALRQSQGEHLTPATLQAIAADLLGERTELLPPLKELVSRPGFQQLLTKAGSGRGAVERRALLADLEKIFTPTVITALEDLLGGLLDLPMTTGSAPPEARTEPTSIAPSQEKKSYPLQISGKRSNHMAASVYISAAVLMVTGVIVARVPAFCTLIGLCESTERVALAQRTLDAAKRAAVALERASSLEDYRSAAEVLEREIQRLSSENLTPRQRQQQEMLVQINRKAQTAVDQHKADLKKLQQARAALVAARSLRGRVEQAVQLAEAEQALQEIGTGGFAAAEANRLRVDVAALKHEQQVKLEKQIAATESLPNTPPSTTGYSHWTLVNRWQNGEHRVKALRSSENEINLALCTITYGKCEEAINVSVNCNSRGGPIVYYPYPDAPITHQMFAPNRWKSTQPGKVYVTDNVPPVVRGIWRYACYGEEYLSASN